MNPAHSQSLDKEPLNSNNTNTDSESNNPESADRENPYGDILTQHVSDAAFLWVLRDIAVNQPHYSTEDLYQLEQRIDAHLDGLMTAPDQAWHLCEQALEFEESGEAFTAAIVAFRSLEVSKIQRAVELGLTNDETSKGLISALAWLPAKLCHPWIEKFLSSKDLDHKFLAIAACSVRRENPGEMLGKILGRLDCRQHLKLYTRCLRIIGELKRHDQIPALEIAVQSKDNNIAFWAAWSLVLLGKTEALQKLLPLVFIQSDYQARAIDIVFRASAVVEGRQYISILAKDEKQVRTVIKASGILGDPHAVTWLIAKMHEPAFARLAGESFTSITGIDLEQRQLANEVPDITEQTPSDDAEDSGVELDEDENLPWPNTEKIAAVWQKYSARYPAGQRHFLGHPINSQLLNHTLQNGLQRQRNAAALELALLEPETILPNTKAKI